MIIVLCGVRGSGKDTIGDILVKNHGFTKEAFANPLKEMVKHAFPAFTDADLYGPSKNRERQYPQYPLSLDRCPLCSRRATQDIADLYEGFTMFVDEGDYWRCEGSNCLLPKRVSPRLALQTLGTEWGRSLYTNVWIDACFERITKANAPDTFRTREFGHLPGRRNDRDYVITDGRFLNETRRSRELGGFAVKLTRGMAESTDPHPSEAELRTMPDSEFDFVFENSVCGPESLPEMVSRLYARLKEKT